MPHFIIKADPDEDFYVEWSNNVDGPLAYGTREELLADMLEWDGPSEARAERFDRADRDGSSALFGGPVYGWDDEEFHVAEPLGGQRRLPRKHLRAYVEALGADDGDIPAAFALTEGFED